MEKKFPLTEDQNLRRLLFIGKCVDTNAVISNSTKFGVYQPLTVQELSQLNSSTLEQIYINIQKQLNESSLGIKKEKKPLLISGLLAEHWLDFIELTVKHKEYLAYSAKKEVEIRNVKKQLESMKSPSQKKKDLLKQLSELEN